MFVNKKSNKFSENMFAFEISLCYNSLGKYQIQSKKKSSPE